MKTKKKVTERTNVRENPLGNKFGFTSLDDVFSRGTAKSKYSTKNKDIYEKQIKGMNLVDLQTHAIGLGLRPAHNRAMLEKNLVNTFSRESTGPGLVNIDPKVKNLNQVMEILSKGA